MRQRLGPVAVVALLTLLPACNRTTTSTSTTGDASAGGGWKEFRIPDVAASVLLPVGDPNDRWPVRQNYSGGGVKDGVAYLARGGGGSHEFVVIVFSPRTTDGQTVDQALDDYLKPWVSDDFSGGKKVEGVGGAGLPGRGYVRWSRGRPEMEWRVFAVGNKWVQLQVSGGENAAPAQVFFDSFKTDDGRAAGRVAAAAGG
ncbi:MAG: hypothetical protein K2P78_12285 [Gemmataceae bacterium]|nr:hypothetical protein [Gemmataceae bacterium]